MSIGPHLCAEFKRLRTNDKMKRHARRCATCREFLRAEWGRRKAARAGDSIEGLAVDQEETFSDAEIRVLVR